MEPIKKNERNDAMLGIEDPLEVDESIEVIDYREYEPLNPAAVNNG
jgi:hypothetical protein